VSTQHSDSGGEETEGHGAGREGRLRVEVVKDEVSQVLEEDLQEDTSEWTSNVTCDK